jgi:hypothetical protein
MKLILDPQNQVALNPIRSEDQAELYALMDQVYRDAYRYVWFDQGDWYVNLIYNPETVQKELSRGWSHYFFVEVADRKIGILKYDYPFSLLSSFEVPIEAGWNLQFHPNILTNLQLARNIKSPIIHFNQALKS